MSAGRGQTEQPQARAAGQFLRLALNLQLDALLFTVSADATSTPSSMTSGPGREPDPLPWEHWLAGDLEAVLRLAQGVVEEHLPLPAVLSGADQRAERVLDDLRARYAAILALLAEAAADVRQTPRVARTVSDLQKHYQERLRELAGGSVPHPPPVVAPPRRGDGATIG